MDKLITRKEAAGILGISVKTLDAARTDGLISYVQYVENGCVYFTEVGIQEYIAKCTHMTKDTIACTQARMIGIAKKASSIFSKPDAYRPRRAGAPR